MTRLLGTFTALEVQLIKNIPATARIADELEVRGDLLTSEAIARFREYIQQLKEQAERARKQRMAQAQVELTIRRYQIMAASDRRHTKVWGYICLFHYAIVRGTRKFDFPMRIKDVNTAAKGEDINVNLLPMVRPSITMAQWNCIQQALKFFRGKMDSRTLFNMPVDSLVRAALNSSPEDAILESKKRLLTR